MELLILNVFKIENNEAEVKNKMKEGRKEGREGGREGKKGHIETSFPC